MSALHPIDTIRCACVTGWLENDGVLTKCPVCDGDPLITLETVAEYARQIDELRKRNEEIRWFTYCVYCGSKEKHDGTPEGLIRLMVDHIEKCEKHPIRKMAEEMEDACSHLGAALSQTIDKDDPIIMGHVREAFRALGGKV